MGVADEEGDRNGADRWLRHNDGHQVLICTAHSYAISSIYGYLSDQHLDIKSKEDNAIVAHYAGVEIRSRKTSRQSRITDYPIPFLLLRDCKSRVASLTSADFSRRAGNILGFTSTRSTLRGT
jgi:hypothetical protein